MAVTNLFRRKKKRKYPIKRNEQGKSARARCFELFKEDVSFKEVADITGVTFDTVRRYHQQWQQLGPNFEKQYTFTKELFKKTAPDRDKNIEIFAQILGIPKEEFETILLQPHGLQRFLTRKLYFPINAEADHRRHVAMKLALVFSDYLLSSGAKYEDVYAALGKYMQENKKYREAEDANIKEDNKFMALVHAVIAADMENERQGRVKPDTLSEQERQVLIKYGLDRATKNLATLYWIQIGIIMATGLTMEEARVKIYQNLIDKGDFKGAETLRQFQDKIHPLSNNNQQPPSKPPPAQPSK